MENQFERFGNDESRSDTAHNFQQPQPEIRQPEERVFYEVPEHQAFEKNAQTFNNATAPNPPAPFIGAEPQPINGGNFQQEQREQQAFYFREWAIFNKLPYPYGYYGWRGPYPYANLNGVPFNPVNHMNVANPYMYQQAHPLQTKPKKQQNTGLAVFLIVVGAMFCFMLTMLVILLQKAGAENNNSKLSLNDFSYKISEEYTCDNSLDYMGIMEIFESHWGTNGEAEK